MRKANSLRTLSAAPVYRNFPLSGNAGYQNYSTQTEDAECIQQVLENLARSRGQTNDVCGQRVVVLSED